MKKWFREMMIVRLVTLIEFEENEKFRQFYMSFLENLIITRARSNESAKRRR